MSAISRQHTCAACGMPFTGDDDINIEPLIDGAVRYVVVHAEHSTSPQHQPQQIPALRYTDQPVSITR